MVTLFLLMIGGVWLLLPVLGEVAVKVFIAGFPQSLLVRKLASVGQMWLTGRGGGEGGEWGCGGEHVLLQ